MFAPATSPPRHATLIVLTAISVLTLNLFLPSLPAMAVDFDVSYGVISLAIAAYMLVSAALGLILGPLADKYGRRPVLLWTLAIFTLASAGAALTTDLTVFLIFRMVQAVCATGSTLSRAIVRDMYPPAKGASVLGYMAMAMAIAPMIGPLAGGLLDEVFGWRSVFWAFCGLGVLGCWLIWADLGETAPARGGAVGSQAQGYKQVATSGAFWSYTLVLGFSISAFFVFLAGAPLVAAEIYDLTPRYAGIALGTTAAGFFAGSFIAGRLSERTSLGKMMVWGRAIGLIGPAVALACYSFGYAPAALTFGVMISIGIANGMSLPSASTGAMSVRPDLAGSASGLSMAIATTMGAGFSALTGAILTPENGIWLLSTLLLAVCICALVAALKAARIDVYSLARS